ncbi:M32 carboxypeptidase Taq metallopeptidase peptidase [Linnemannia elongata AG-77]|uniref:M32 carboxypeptidase Taq metallopeptidase peptidase n=1 Tax=Linnemannia elongata AG-77 TaxID=1314771 RepID=A0A197KGA8_9FUNG|nr:M32 carboxypeptidase Taq metallopeptidase peptidase [Linnemannia elongata AG-77]
MTVSASNPSSSSDLEIESARSLYEKLVVLLKDISHIKGIASLLGWDQLLSVLEATIHDMETSPILGAILEECERRRLTGELSNELNPYELANIRVALKSYRRETLLPKDLVRAIAASTAKANCAWKEAREASDWSKFAPMLEEQVMLTRQNVAYLINGGVCEEARKINQKARAAQGLSDEDECYKGYYQVLLDEYEPGFKDDRLQVLLADLKKDLIPLIAKIKAKNFQHENGFLKGEFDIKKQAEFSDKFPARMGFNMDAGRLDESTHPFSSNSHPTDVRMATRYTLDNFQEGIANTIHETGHALYEQGRNKEYVDTPVSSPLSVGIHESQSLLWERMVMLSKPFWTYSLPILKEQFPEREDLQAVDVNQFYLALNRAEPTFIRLDADEVTYSMHIILRYEIEKALIEGDIQVADVPALWNAKMKEYLGLDVTEDRLGCLQDIHWSVGVIGLFPTYTLGAIYAVQIYSRAREDIPDLDEHLAKGNMIVLKEWLNKNVHESGSLHESGDDLIFELTGKPLDSSLYVKYLTEKFTSIYNL